MPEKPLSPRALCELVRRSLPWRSSFRSRAARPVMNDRLYLRIENSDLVCFCMLLIEDLYQVEQVELKYSGFRYSA